MKSTRITKHNKLRKNSKLEKRVIKGGTKKGNKKHTKKSRKMLGGTQPSVLERAERFGEVVGRNRPVVEDEGIYGELGNGIYGGDFNITPRYAQLNRNLPNGNYNTSSSIELELFRKIVEKISKLLQNNPNAIEKIKDALNRLNVLSAEELTKLQGELEQLIDNSIYEVIGEPGTTKPPVPTALPRTTSLNRNPTYQRQRNPPKKIMNCGARKPEECELFDGCKLVLTNSKKFGIFPIKIKTCIEKSALDPRKSEPDNQTY
jgi:hypothetical protein